MTTPDELQRAVQRLTEEARVAVECSWPWSVVLPSDLRLLLSERAELLATVERMRDGLTDAASAFDLVVEILESYGDNTTARVMKMKAQQTRAALTTGEANHKDKP